MKNKIIDSLLDHQNCIEYNIMCIECTRHIMEGKICINIFYLSLAYNLLCRPRYSIHNNNIISFTFT